MQREVIDLEEEEEGPARPAAAAHAPVVIDLCEGGLAPSDGVVRASTPRRPSAPGARAAPAGNVREAVLPDGVVDASIGDVADAIVQQLNCIGVSGRGLAKAVATAFPYADSYAEREKSSKWGIAQAGSFARPGSIHVRRPHATGAAGPVVFNLFSQWEMGAPLKYNRVPTPDALRDSREQRELWFEECLDEVSRTSPLPKSIAFPVNIGCGLGGGRWENYERMIRAFAAKHPAVSVLIVKQGAADRGGRAGGGRPATGKRSRAVADDFG